MDYRNKYMVQPGSSVQLDQISASDRGDVGTKKSGLQQLEANRRKLVDLQYLLYAESRRSLLIVLQGRDAAGKDGTIRHVLNAMNPQGCIVTSFKVPSRIEADHDFLWRVHRVTPQCGQVAVFNRSHYEDVLVVRVHGLVPPEVWSRRYDHINAFEELLRDHGTHVLKFFLHIDRDEQLERFKRRIDDPAKHWKLSEADYSERALWEQYTEAFQEALERCSTQHAPWFVIPSNRKWFRNLAISRIIVETLQNMDMRFPEPTVNMDDILRKYHQAAT